MLYRTTLVWHLFFGANHVKFACNVRKKTGSRSRTAPKTWRGVLMNWCWTERQV